MKTMALPKYINYILILIGCIIAIYAQADEQQNTIYLVVGIVVLMFGLFNLSRGIPSKKNDEDEEF